MTSRRSRQLHKLLLLALVGFFVHWLASAWPRSALAGSLGAGAAVVAPADIAVVVHGKVPVDNLSMADLRKVLMGDRQFWSPGLRVSILLRAPVARERDVLLKKVYKMSEAQFRQYWIAKVFRAEVQSGPKVVYTNQTALELVENLPGAIAFVESSQLPKDVKQIKIDGKAPGEKGYPLQ